MASEYRVRITHQAMEDIESIREFISQDSPLNASKMIARLFDAFDSLEQFPHRTVTEIQVARLNFPVRSIVVRPYIIYFWVDESENVVVIRHIRHGARRPPDVLD
jgi:plasmid stabilization system protein ParE